MKTLSDISLKIKVPVVITTLCVVTALVIGLSNYTQFRNTLLNLKSQQFEASLASKKASLEHFFGEIERNLLTMARNPSTANALSQFSEAWAELGEDPEGTLQDLYIHSNPNPVGEKHRLVRAADTSFYSIVHADTHPYFADVIETYGYYDIFLFDPEGNLVYSTFKELDFATNFQSGIFAGS